VVKIEGLRGVIATKEIKKALLRPEGFLSSESEAQRVKHDRGVYTYTDTVVDKCQGYEWVVGYTFANGKRFGIVPLNDRNNVHYGPLMNDGFSSKKNNFKIFIQKYKGHWVCKVYATRSIQPNEPCCVEYGDSFWAFYLKKNPECPPDLRQQILDYYFKGSEDKLKKLMLSV